VTDLLDLLAPLSPMPAATRPDLLAAPVLAALAYVPEALVFEIDPAIADTAALMAAYDLPAEPMGNAVLVSGRRDGEERGCCAVVLASRRVDVNGVVRKQLDVRKASFATMDDAVESSGMEHGAITPVGLGPQWPVLLDQTVCDTDWLVVGSGVRRSKLVIHGASLLGLPGARLVPGLTREVPAQPAG